MMSPCNIFLAAIVLFGCVNVSTSAIIKSSCTVNPTTYGPNATSCSNTKDSALCAALFPPLTAAPFRNLQCERPELEAIALECANTCFACCETAAYTCGDNLLSPVNCTANYRYCTDPAWQSVMSTYCTGTCGLCTSASASCKDVLTGCKDMRSLCNDINFNAYMTTNCRKTCNFCPLTGVSTTSATGTCVDVAPNCATNIALCSNAAYTSLMTQKCARTCNRCSGTGSTTCIDNNPMCATWVPNGFCTNTFYTSAQKQSFCARSCNLC